MLIEILNAVYFFSGNGKIGFTNKFSVLNIKVNIFLFSEKFWIQFYWRAEVTSGSLHLCE
jgi:hypothetical protein